MLPLLLVGAADSILPMLVGYNEHDQLVGIDFIEADVTNVTHVLGAVNADPAGVFYGASVQQAVEALKRAAEDVRPLRPRGHLFAPPSGFLTGYEAVRHVLETHRALTPTVDTIRHSAVFAGMTIRTSIEVAERAYQCIVDLYKAHGDKFAPIEKVRTCIRSLGFPKTREPMYREIQKWAPVVQAAMRRGLRDRELRRHLILETEVPTLLSITKVSFTLALLGQDCVCLDARLLARSGLKEDWRGKTELALQRYERAEDAFLKGNPNYDPADPIGRARAQWISWEVSPVRGAVKPASHSVWLNVVRETSTPPRGKLAEMAASPVHHCPQCPCSHTHPPNVPTDPCPTPAPAPSPPPGEALAVAVVAAERTGYEVAYLSSGARRTHLVSDSPSGTFTLERATSLMRGLKRRGLTAWIEDAHYNFVPVPGAMRRPSYNDEHGKTVRHGAGETLTASELQVVERDTEAVRKGRKLPALNNARDVYDFVQPHVEKLSQEVVLVCPVDLRRKPLAPEPFIVAMGQRAEVSVDRSDALRPVGDTNAAAVVFCHNHPSGDARPSKQDEKLTRELKQSLKAAYPSVTFLDHVVIGDGQFYSFSEGKLYKIRGRG